MKQLLALIAILSFAIPMFAKNWWCPMDSTKYQNEPEARKQCADRAYYADQQKTWWETIKTALGLEGQTDYQNRTTGTTGAGYQANTTNRSSDTRPSGVGYQAGK